MREDNEPNEIPFVCRSGVVGISCEKIYFRSSIWQRLCEIKKLFVNVHVELTQLDGCLLQALGDVDEIDDGFRGDADEIGECLFRELPQSNDRWLGQTCKLF